MIQESAFSVAKVLIYLLHITGIDFLTVVSYGRLLFRLPKYYRYFPELLLRTGVRLSDCQSHPLDSVLNNDCPSLSANPGETNFLVVFGAA